MAKRGKGSGSVVRGRFNPRHQASTIARRNKNAVAPLPVLSDLRITFGTPEGQVFRAMEIIAAAPKKRFEIEARLRALIGNGQTIEEIAWEFVQSPESEPGQKKFSLDDAARAKAFLIVAYGPRRTST